MSGRRLGLLALALALAARGARADDGAPASPYAPVPASIEALAATPTETTLAARGLAALASPVPDEARQAVRDLLAAGPGGLRAAARRLAAGPVDDRALVALVQVVAASPVQDVDALLAIAARSDLPEVRCLAATGLAAGRTGTAVDTLAALARDRGPGVRACALRALFALESPAAVAARVGLPLDVDPALAALRLRLHRLRGDDAPAVASLAAAAFAHSRLAAVRLEAARLLATLDTPAHDDLRLVAVAESASDPVAARALREALGVPTVGYDPATARMAAAEALLALLSRPSTPVDVRAELLDLAVEWLARPARVRGASYDDEARLRLAIQLPNVGDALVAPVVRRLLADRFEDPHHAVSLLLSLDPETALRALGDVVLQRPPAKLLEPLAGGLRALGRVGRREVAEVLLDPAATSSVRNDAVLALAGEPAALALPLLERALVDRDDAVASHAAEALLARPEPQARALLTAALEDGRWRQHETQLLTTLAEHPDDAIYALFERLLVAGPRAVRERVLDVLKAPSSPMKGPRAVALVHRAAEDLSLAIDPMAVAPALATVDGPAGVRYVRERWRAVRGPGVFLRNLHVVADPSALAFALEVAGGLADTDEDLLGELMTVIAGPSGRDVARADPFWRRMLASGRPTLARLAVRHLAQVPHGPMADLLVPIVERRDEDALVRIDALRACATQDGQPPTALLWSIAADPLEDYDLRNAAAELLAKRPDASIRAKALAWLAARADEYSEPAERIAPLAGLGATPGQAADLLRLLDRELDARYAEPPYFRIRPDEDQRSEAARSRALALAIVATGDPAALGALAARLFDPRFARFSTEARRYAGLGRRRGGGPVAAVVDPPDPDVVLLQATEDVNAAPVAPIPEEAQAIAAALATQAGAGALRALARAIDDARTSGRIAAFSDVYLTWVLLNVTEIPTDLETLRTAGDDDEVVEAVATALDLTWPAGGVEEARVLRARLERRARRGDWAGATADAGRIAALCARTGIADASLARRGGEERAQPLDWASWRVLRAREDLFAATGAAIAGKTEEARALFRRAVDRAPDDPVLLRLCAQLKLHAGFDLPGAADDVARSLELTRRAGSSPAADVLRIADLIAKARAR